MKNYKNVHKKNNMRVNTSDYYSELKAAINTRHQLDSQMDRLWDQIRNGYSRSAEMDSVTARIGKATYKIDSIIHKLSRCRNQHSAIKLAKDFLNGERLRAQRIISSKSNLVNKVNRGQTTLISSRGVVHTDTSNLTRYLEGKKRRLREINRMLNELS